MIKTIDKRLALQSITDHQDFEHRLFFQARNLAIEAMLLRWDNRFLRLGFNVTSSWRETSFGGPTVEITYHNPKFKEGTWEAAAATVRVDRETILTVGDCSRCFYRLRTVEVSEYWPGREPKLVVDFRAAVKALVDQGFFEAEVLKVNYPFEREPYSVF